ncbi:MAG: N-acetylglucosamine-6-phosphate deacetylase [Phycisphaerae bacterium]|nr:N-acetylglucosamine-6-phosphate deacetylase [Phycisphaerae bacterium]
MTTLAINNIKLIDSGNLANVLVRDGIVTEILDTNQPCLADTTFDGGGLYLCPGFFDLHIHGAGGGTVLRSSSRDLETISKTVTRFGTTRFLATTCFEAGGNNQCLKRAADACGKSLGGAKIAGLYLEGPFINPLRKGMIPSEFITQPNEDLLNQIFDLTGPHLKMMTVAPELPGAHALIEKLLDRGVTVSFGHSDADYDQTLAGIAAGITHATHLFNGMRPIHHRDPGPIPALLQNDKITLELISDGAHVSPPIAKLISKLIPPERLCLITDGLELLGLPDGVFDHKGRTVHARNGSVRHGDGSLVGTTLGQSQLLSRFAQFTGWGIEQAVRAASITPKAAIGQADPADPLIQVGQIADLVLAKIEDDTLVVQKTFVDGQVVFERK